MTTPAVRIENLTQIFPVPLRRQRVTAVRDLSFEVRPGEVSDTGALDVRVINDSRWSAPSDHGRGHQ